MMHPIIPCHLLHEIFMEVFCSDYVWYKAQLTGCVVKEVDNAPSEL